MCGDLEGGICFLLPEKVAFGRRIAANPGSREGIEGKLCSDSLDPGEWIVDPVLRIFWAMPLLWRGKTKAMESAVMEGVAGIAALGGKWCKWSWGGTGTSLQSPCFPYYLQQVMEEGATSRKRSSGWREKRNEHRLCLSLNLQIFHWKR